MRGHAHDGDVEHSEDGGEHDRHDQREGGPFGLRRSGAGSKRSLVPPFPATGLAVRRPETASAVVRLRALFTG